MPLEMKYFVLNPRSKQPYDPFALASREAMRMYAMTIESTDPELAKELREWAQEEVRKEVMLENIED